VTLVTAEQAVVGGVISGQVAALTEGVIETMWYMWYTKLRWTVIVMLMLAVGGLGAGGVLLRTHASEQRRASPAFARTTREEMSQEVIRLEHADATEITLVLDEVFAEQIKPKGKLAIVAEPVTNALLVQGTRTQTKEIRRLVTLLDAVAARREARKNQEAVRDDVQDHVKYLRLKTDKATTKPRLGVNVEPVAPVLAAQFELSLDVGVVVTRVVPGSPAEKAGIKVHDVVLKIGGAQVTGDVEDFVRLIDSLKSDKPLDIVVLRKGRKHTIAGVRLTGS
jgi:C-terminal processing protease CtpA/Prc